MKDLITSKKILFIKEELKRFQEVKRKCKYAYKNWFRTSSHSSCGIIKNDLWKSPKFSELNDNYYVSFYGKYYITCLHILYNKLRHEKVEKSHIINTKYEIYSEGVRTVHMWVEERVRFSHSHNIS